MAGGKQSPRQKMINLMYLVFIAMLAMQIDRQVLRSFENVEISLGDATGLTKKNNDGFYQVISDKAGKDPEYIPIQNFTSKVKEMSDDLVSHIDKIKSTLDGKTGWVRPIDGAETKYNSLNNTDVLHTLMFVDGGKPSNDAEVLKQKVDGLREFLIQNLDKNKDTSIIDQVNSLFKTEGKGNKNWLETLFYDQPMIAGKTNLTKIQSDVRTVEGNIIRSRLSSKLLQEVEIKAFQGVIMAPVYLEKGKGSTATVALGAFDNGIRGTAIVNGQAYPLVSGKATIPLSAASSGKFTLQGKIDFTDKQGKTQSAELAPSAYEVVERVARTELPDPDGVVSAEKMNVVYRGLPNPIVASVTGAAAGSVSLSGPGLVKSGNGWVLTPSSGQSVTLNLSAKNEEGKAFSKAFTFRIKNIPPPQGQIRGQNTVSMPASALENQVVEARIPDFDWPVNFQVTSCKVKVSGKPTLSIQGASLKAASAIVKGLRSGDVVNVFDIKVIATGLGDQQIKNVSPVAVSIQ